MEKPAETAELLEVLRDGDYGARCRALVGLSRIKPSGRGMKALEEILSRVDEEPGIAFAAGRIYDRWRAELGRTSPLEAHVFVSGKFLSDEAERIFRHGAQYAKLSVIRRIAGHGKCREAFAFLLRKARSEKDRFVLSALLKHLGLFGDEAALPVLEEFRGHRDDRIRANAMLALGLLSGKGLWKSAARLMLEGDGGCRFELAEILNEADPKRARRLIMKFGGGDSKMRSAAMDFIEAISPRWAEDLLLSMIPSEKEAELLKRECVLLSRYGTARGIKSMVELLEGASGGRAALFRKTVEKIRENTGLDDEAMAVRAGDSAVWRRVGSSSTDEANGPGLLGFLAPVVIGVVVFSVLVGIMLGRDRLSGGTAIGTTSPSVAAVAGTGASASDRARVEVRKPVSRETIEARRARLAASRARMRRNRERLARMNRKRRRQLAVCRKPRRWGRGSGRRHRGSRPDSTGSGPGVTTR